MDPNNLEECWFFGNLLETKSKSIMVRSLSDPCSSSSEKSYEETYETIKKLESRRRSSNRKSSSKKKSGLARAPSLPTSLESRDDDDDEVEFSMGKLIRQASLNTRLPPPPSQIASNKASASLNCLEVEEVQQGLKDLGSIEKEFDVVERRAPPVPRWGGKRAPDEMKAQIKFWARAVASNVRQEC
ncbi:hypothetical protein SASPL_114809 [Salvia splendens]|uniref:Uncharacterized protein n=1 Tax=Salvia splendens TaxID=180675 RepID=A0A8X9A1J2_SALSN|nr:uncharacterized protein LOC121802706 [Salvia splendens]KAG6424391.1 hypothetical protein SASPL_114809 [Salvia splendens]